MPWLAATGHIVPCYDHRKLEEAAPFSLDGGGQAWPGVGPEGGLATVVGEKARPRTLPLCCSIADVYSTQHAGYACDASNTTVSCGLGAVADRWPPGCPCMAHDVGYSSGRPPGGNRVVLPADWVVFFAVWPPGRNEAAASCARERRQFGYPAKGSTCGVVKG